MDIHQIWAWLKDNWINVGLWIGWILAVDAIIKQTAQKYGKTQIVSYCDLIANDLNFVLDVFIGILTMFKKTPTPTIKPPDTGIVQKEV